MTLTLLIGSSAALVLLFIHAWRTRGRKVTLCFFGFGLLFGILRGNTVWTILRTVEENVDALKPYAPQGGLLPEIGHASLQVAFGWVFA
ncbi:MAG TPA: hypothetical protein VMX57_09890, partial [Planctomycetota bacterium]|nr:hypothetical protein [Planctomycetota bacterium]